jgi:hypothetical protein
MQEFLAFPSWDQVHNPDELTYHYTEAYEKTDSTDFYTIWMVYICQSFHIFFSITREFFRKKSFFRRHSYSTANSDSTPSNLLQVNEVNRRQANFKQPSHLSIINNFL